ncbi:glycosyltransferase family 4 protein [Luteimonas sp. RIT-PG2_3]
MRHAIVTETYPPEVNGVALTVRSLETGLRARGHDVSVIRPRQLADSAADLPQDDGGQPLLVRGLGLPRYPGLRFGMPSTRRLVRQWQQARPDAIYIATEGPLGWSALRAARQLQIPVATGFHTRFDHYMRDYGVRWMQPVALAWMRRFHNAGNATLVPTCELLDFLHGAGFQHPVRLARAVDSGLFNRQRRDIALRRQLGVADDALMVIHVGRIAAEKNLDLAVRAFRAIQRQRADARFVWVGDGPLRESLQAGHPDFVFAGIQRGEELACHFASADLFLFPSLSETFGNVTLEALASGVPTVAFDYGAAREHLSDGMHGRRVDSDAAFIAASVELATQDQRRTVMGLSAADAMLALRPEQVAIDFESILHRLAHQGTTHAPDAFAPSHVHP